MKKREQRHEPVFKAVVLVTNQEECNVAKNICKTYNLPIWEDESAFDYVDHEGVYLFYKDTGCNDDNYAFYVDILNHEDLEERNIVSIEEFEQLANELNPQYNSVDDILIKMKELNRMLN